jgi:hypothetical protein
MAHLKSPSRLTILALIIASACGSSSGAPNLVSGGSSTPAVTPSKKSTLDLIVLKALDVGADAVEEPLPKGNMVAGQVTLDLCAASFPSEALRTARLQVAFVAGRHLAISNEVVSYRTGGTRRALAELRAAAAHCPDSFRVPGAIASHLRVERRDSRLVSRQLTVSALFTPKKAVHVWSVAVYQFDGNQFSGVYVFADSRASALRLARRMAAISAGRLQAALVGF